jgi:TonB family protein
VASALKEARLEPAVGVDFAGYLNAMHRPIHTLFTDGFLSSLSLLPCDDPLNDIGLMVRLEIVLTADGRVKQMGVIRSSNEPDFDIAALDSVDRAQPFADTPPGLRSPDGFVYLQWEFHRNELYACSTMGIRPFVWRPTGGQR